MPKRKSSASLTLVLVADANGNGQPDRGDTIAFTVAPPGTDWNQIQVAGRQNGVVVYSGLISNPAHLPGSVQELGLGSQSWTSGPADMTATLGLFHDNDPKKTETLATLSFPAGG